jgi:hypothetical protein
MIPSNTEPRNGRAGITCGAEETPTGAAHRPADHDAPSNSASTCRADALRAQHRRPAARRRFSRSLGSQAASWCRPPRSCSPAALYCGRGDLLGMACHCRPGDTRPFTRAHNRTGDLWQSGRWMAARGRVGQSSSRRVVRDRRLPWRAVIQRDRKAAKKSPRRHTRVQ